MKKHQDTCVPLTMARTLPEKAKVVVLPLYMPSSFRCPMFSWTAAWSLAVISLFVHALHHNSFILETLYSAARCEAPAGDISISLKEKASPLAGDVQIDVLALVVDHDANAVLCNSTIAEVARLGGQKAMYSFALT